MACGLGAATELGVDGGATIARLLASHTPRILPRPTAAQRTAGAYFRPATRKASGSQASSKPGIIKILG